MNRTLRSGALLAALVIPAVASAQNVSVLFDAGQRQDQYGDASISGMTKNSLTTVGFGLTSVIGGSSSDQVAILLPITFEGRYLFGSANSPGRDLNLDTDLMMRLSAVALGVGVAGRAPEIARKYEYNCTPYQGCPSSGVDQADADEAMVVGPSLSGKINIGPNGRLFIQGKTIDLSTALDTRGSGTSCSTTTCFDTYKPKYQGGHESRASAGFAFSHGGATQVLRVQWIRQSMEYELAEKNWQGALNRRSDTFTIGWAFGF